MTPSALRSHLQEEALKPFVAVLRLADSPAVRQRAVRAVAAAITAHPRGLGSGGSVAGVPRTSSPGTKGPQNWGICRTSSVGPLSAHAVG